MQLWHVHQLLLKTRFEKVTETVDAILCCAVITCHQIPDSVAIPNTGWWRSSSSKHRIKFTCVCRIATTSHTSKQREFEVTTVSDLTPATIIRVAYLVGFQHSCQRFLVSTVNLKPVNRKKSSKINMISQNAILGAICILASMSHILSFTGPFRAIVRQQSSSSSIYMAGFGAKKEVVDASKTTARVADAAAPCKYLISTDEVYSNYHSSNSIKRRKFDLVVATSCGPL